MTNLDHFIVKLDDFYYIKDDKIFWCYEKEQLENFRKARLLPYDSKNRFLFSETYDDTIITSKEVGEFILFLVDGDEELLFDKSKELGEMNDGKSRIP